MFTVEGQCHIFLLVCSYQNQYYKHRMVYISQCLTAEKPLNSGLKDLTLCL